MNSDNNYKLIRKSEQMSNNIYQKPLPIDTVNKFWGIDSRLLKQDDTVQKQSFDQAYKNFWSYVDYNSNYNYDNINKPNTANFTNTFSNSNNQYSRFSYNEARKRADELLRQENKIC